MLIGKKVNCFFHQNTTKSNAKVFYVYFCVEGKIGDLDAALGKHSLNKWSLHLCDGVTSFVLMPSGFCWLELSLWKSRAAVLPQ